MTGAGVKEFFDAVDASRTEYEKCVSLLCQPSGAKSSR